MFTPSITAFDTRNLKRQRDHTIILITHFHPNRSFPELTFLHRVSIAFFNIHHFREEKKKLGKKDIRKILYKNRFERARLALLSVLVNYGLKVFQGHHSLYSLSFNTVP